MDQIRRQSLCGSDDSLNSDTKGYSDKTTDSFERISDLNKRIDSSLYVSKEPESKPTEAIENEQRDISETSIYQKNIPEIFSEQSSVQDFKYSSSESESREVQTPQSTKAVDDESSSGISKTIDSTKNIEIRNLPPYSRRSPKGKQHYRPNTQHFSRTDPKHYSTGYYHSVHPASLLRSSNPLQNQACAYPEQYSRTTFMDPNIAYRQDKDRFQYKYQTAPSSLGRESTYADYPRMRSYQRQVQPTVARPIALVPTSRILYHNPMPPIRTNATPMRYDSGFSNRNPRPPIMTNATPMRYVRCSSRFQQRPLHPDRTKTSMQHIDPPLDTASNFSRGMNCSSDIIPNKLDTTTTEQVVTLITAQSKTIKTKEIDDPNTSTENLEQPETVTELENLAKSTHYSKRNVLYVDIPKNDSPTFDSPFNLTPQEGTLPRQVQRTPFQHPTSNSPKEIDNQNTSTENLEQPENVTKLKNLAKSTHYSKRNMLYVDIPKKDSPASDFPLNLPPQAGIVPLQVQRIPIQYPPPPSSGGLFSAFEVGRRIIPHRPNNYFGACAQLRGYSYFNPVIPDQSFIRQTVQDNTFIQSESNVGNSIQPAIQAQIERTQRSQYQPVIQNLISEPQYWDSNHPVVPDQSVQDNTFIQSTANSMQPAIQAEIMTTQRVQYHPATQDLITEPQYQDPNNTICEYGTQYVIQPNMQNITAQLHYQDPNSSTYQYGTQYQPVMHDPNYPQYQYGTQYQPVMHDPNYPQYQYGTQASLETSWQPNTPRPYPMYDASFSIQQHNTNIVPMQTSVTNPSSTAMIQNSQWPYGSGNPSYPFNQDPNLVPNVPGVQTSVENPFSFSASPYSLGLYAANETTNPVWIDDPNQGSNPHQGTHFNR